MLVVACVTAGDVAAARAADLPGKTPIRRSEQLPSTASPNPSPASGGTALVFLGLLLAGAIVVRRILQQRTAAPARGNSTALVTLLRRQQVDGELTVRLLQIGPRVLVVGSAPQGLATLAELTDPAEIAALAGEQPPATAKRGSADLFSGRASIAGASHERCAEGEPRPAERPTSRILSRAEAGG